MTLTSAEPVVCPADSFNIHRKIWMATIFLKSNLFVDYTMLILLLFNKQPDVN